MIILASSSPRRKILLRKIVKSFLVIKPNIVEREFKFNPHQYALELSKLKAYSVFNKYQDDTIIACDTIVLLNQRIINKPKNDLDAKRILRLLSNKTHLVISGYTIINRKHEINRQVISEVTFNKLSGALINEYVKKGYAKGKAGAYGVQDPYPIVKKVVGSYTNVVGLPIEDITKFLIYLH